MVIETDGGDGTDGTDAVAVIVCASAAIFSAFGFKFDSPLMSRCCRPFGGSRVVVTQWALLGGTADSGAEECGCLDGAESGLWL